MLLVISQNRLRWWIGAISQQGITYSNPDKVLCMLSYDVIRPKWVRSIYLDLQPHVPSRCSYCAIDLVELLPFPHFTWWRHQMETFSALLAFGCGVFAGHRWIPRTKASDAELWCFLWSAPEPTDMKTMRRRWFETPSPSLWRHCNASSQSMCMCSFPFFMFYLFSLLSCPGPTFIKPDQRNPWIKDQLGNDLLSTILHLQLPNFVSCGRDKPSHMTQNLVTVGAKL